MDDIAHLPNDADQASTRPRRQHAPARQPWGVTLIVIWLVLGVVLSIFQIMSLRDRIATLEQEIVTQAPPSTDPDPKFAKIETAFSDMMIQFKRDEQSYAFMEIMIYGLGIPLNLLAAVGLWRLKRWARQLLIGVGVLTALATLLTDMFSGSAFWMVVIMIYLLLPGGRDPFRPTPVSRRSGLLS